jgi:hypothetical protein
MKPKIIPAGGTPKRGRGRPAKHDYSWFEPYKEQLLACDDPMQIAILAQKIAARALIGQAEGKGAREHNAEIRAWLRLILSAVPKERLARAEKIIREAAAPRRPIARAAGKILPRDKKGKLLRGG